MLGKLVHVASESERHDIGVETVDNGARLLARAAVRLLDGHVFVGGRLPVLGEGCVEFLIELAGRVIGDIEEFGGIGRHGTGQADAEAEGTEPPGGK